MSSSPDETAPLVDISGLHYRYAGAQADALADLELEVYEGEFVAVVGANGSGKSTLARLIGGLEKPAAARRALACGHDLLVEGGRMAARAACSRTPRWCVGSASACRRLGSWRSRLRSRDGTSPACRLPWTSSSN